MSDVPKGYRMSEVGVIPEEWKVIKLEDVFEFKNGLNKEKEYFGHGTPIVNYIDVYKNNALSAKDLMGKVTVTKTELKAYEVRKDDVFFTRTSETVDEIGITSVITDKLEKTVFSGFILRARPKNNWLDTLYKKYCFSSENVRKEITSKSSYTTRALTNGRLLSEVQIPLPHLPEQQAIASALSDVDALITALEQLITKKRNIKQGAMQQLLTGEKRLPGFGGEWEVRKLGEICNKFLNGGTPSTLKAEYWYGNIPWISGADIVTQKITKTRRFISEDAVENSSTNIIEKGNLLLVTRTGVGKMTIAPFDIAISQDLTGIYIKSEEVYTEYVFHYFNFNSTILKSFNQGTSISGITRDTLTSIPILYPPTIQEQQAIAQILSDMDSEIEALEQKRDKYKAIKKGMIQELLTGKTRLV